MLSHMVKSKEYTQKGEHHKAESKMLHSAPVSTKSMVTANPTKYMYMQQIHKGSLIQLNIKERSRV